MEIEGIETHSEHFDDIVEDIKQRNLSRNNMPKLIIGTGLSILYGIPGMKELAEHLDKEIDKENDEPLKKMWAGRYKNIMTKGLEAGLVNLLQEESKLVDFIKTSTAEYILESEENLHDNIIKSDTGFSRLLVYLSETVTINNKVIDIMTPNYDRIIEIVCDKLGIGVINGFYGSLYGKFDRDLLRHPTQTYNCITKKWVRLFKPHGSINWINENGNEYLTNDYSELSKKTEYIEIVTPGSSKYRESMTNNTFRCMREEFNDLLTSLGNYSLLFYGYGFNDDHFNTALMDSFEKNVLIMARDVKKEILDTASKSKNITVFYQENGEEYMIYKAKKYIIDLSLWDINEFADVFFG